MSVWINSAIAINMIWSRITLRRSLLKAAENVEDTQAFLLRTILHDNNKTRFGQEHRFSKIKSIKDFRDRVPISSYETLEPYVEAQKLGERALSFQPPIYYARTSGTTGRYKDIPLTRYGVRQIKRAQKQLAVTLWSQTGFFKGSVLGFASPGEEGRLKNGKPFGSTSGVTYNSLSTIIEKKICDSQASLLIQ